MEGLIVLTSEVMYSMPIWTELICYAGLALLVLCLFLYIFNSWTLLPFAGIGGTGLVFLGVLLGLIFQQPSYTRYEVTFTDTISLAEFNEKYEVLDQREKIYVIKEKEN